MITAATWNPAQKSELPGMGGTMRHVAIKADTVLIEFYLA